MAPTTATIPEVTPLLTQVGYVHYAFNANVAGLTHADSLAQPEPGGNCLNWIVGHLCHAQNNLLAMLGQKPFWSEEISERYKRGSEPITDADDALPFEEMVRLFNESQAPVMEGLSAMTSEKLSAKAPFSPTDNPDETVGSLLAGIIFHQAYTIGQTGLSRRLVRKAGAIK